MDKQNVLTLRPQMLKHYYDYEVTCMQVSIVCMDNGIQSDSIVTTQHSNACLCEHARIWGSARENWAYVIFNISSIHLAVSLRPLKLCPSNLLHILPDHFTTAFCCRMFFFYSLGGPHD